ncbi:hypothetical protein L2E82_06831 [Cichorium intybus]|uniref:Uncharacterized protein n=1 Tax=Cichorium intybus TaxID=13427 RepID=A0ACB9HAM5_CICIN|nr:hypothetical protein L2E82_06831 [Cichorium intybus]
MWISIRPSLSLPAAANGVKNHYRIQPSQHNPQFPSTHAAIPLFSISPLSPSSDSVTIFCSLVSRIRFGSQAMDDVCEGTCISLVEQEEKILEWWSEVKAFDTQLEKTKDLLEYVFHDGPAFATGLPHYGHILAGTIKDIVTRYQTMTGHHVTRRFGWDCHGLPVEHEIDMKLGIKSREDVRWGVGKGNYQDWEVD